MSEEFDGPAPEPVALVEGWAARSPLAVAVVCGAERLTYRDLNTRANRLARLLIRRGAGGESLVGLMLPRTADLLVALLAVAKAGAAHVPLDPTHPARRNGLILDDAEPLLVLTAAGPAGVPDWLTGPHLPLGSPAVEAELATLPGGDIGSGELRRGRHPGHPAWVLHTSGSTGRPKGVVVPRAGLANILADFGERLGAGPDDRLLAVTTLGFDIAGLELFLPLVSGGTVVLATEAEQRDPIRLAAVIRRSGITIMQATPSLWDVMLENPALDLSRVRAVVGGEALPAALARRMRAAGATVINAYGPTETTIWSTAHALGDEARAGAPPIGTPVRGTRAYVLDDLLRPVPDGAAGELYLAGAGLARGYHHRPGLTATRFVADPFGPGGDRMYRTGDRVRRATGGLLEFIGRTDHQVKISGHRVELGEIEAAAGELPGVARAVAVVRADPGGHQHLTLYVVPLRDGALDPGRIPGLLAERLPRPMVPGTVLTLDSLPRTPNGKIDRAALPDPGPVARTGTVAPASAGEARVCGLFAALLGVPRVGATDDFFALGGDSLLAIRLIGRLHHELGGDLELSRFFDAPTPRAVHERLHPPLVSRAGPEPAERPERLPLSSAQRRLWFLNRMEGRTATYNMPVRLRLHGPLDRPALESALSDLVTRHEPLRTRYPEEAGEPRQEIVPPAAARPRLPVTGCATTAEAARAATEFFAAGFALGTDLPLRTRLLRLGPGEHELLLVVHHIAYDGLSTAPLIRDLLAAYEARRKGLAPPARELALQYADYALWQQRHFAHPGEPGSPAGAHLDHWRSALSGMPDELELPFDRPRPQRASYRGGTVSLTVDPGLHRELAELARGAGASLYMALQALLGGLLTRLGAGTDLPIGCPVAGRDDPALEDLVGFFVNTLVLRTDTSGDPGFRTLLGRVRDADLRAFAHRDVPFELVVEALAPARSLARHPLFQVLLVSQVPEQRTYRVDGLDVEWDEPSNGTAKFDLSVSYTERRAAEGQPGGIDIAVEYASDLFDRATAERIGGYLLRLLRSAVAGPDVPLSRLDMLGRQERQLLEEWNDTSVGVARRTLPDLLDRQAGRTPDAVAVRYEDELLTYRELAARSNRMARLLIRRGAGPEAVVAIRISRSVDLIVATLAVIKTGAAYLPLDPDYPSDRIAYMLADSRPVCVLTTAGTAGETPGDRPRLVIDSPETKRALASLPDTDLPDAERTLPLRPEHPVYVLYTSGSTGRPKGVVLPTLAMVNLLAWHAGTMGGGVGRTTAQFANLSFDAAAQEILSALTSGKTLAVVRDDHRKDAEQFARWLGRMGVNELFAPTPVVEALVDAAQRLGSDLPHLAHVAQAGEALILGPALRRFFAPGTGRRLYNYYGPTETHVATGCLVAAGHLTGPGQPPIGGPIGNTRAYVLDQRLVPVAQGVAGELYLAGDQLARGYVNRPALTAARFVADPFGGPGSRMYRTGDRVRRLPGGALQFLGRTDFQVKLRGFRVEPGEVEAVLAEHPEVVRAVVLVREDRPGDKRLVAYVAGNEDARLDPAALRQTTVRRLPDYMVPAAVVVLPRIPLTPNGKVDRAALPAPVFATGAGGHDPADEREAALCAIFADVLGLPRVGPADDFFALGGHSLLATRLVSRIRAELRCEVDIRDLFEDATVRGIASRLTPDAARPAPVTPAGGDRDEGDASTRPATGTSGSADETGDRRYPVTFEQESMWLEEQVADGGSALLESWVCRLRGPVDVAAVTWALTEVVRRQDALRTRLVLDGDALCQVVRPEPELVLHRLSCTEETLDAELRRAVSVPLDVEEAPLRATLLELAADDVVLAVEFHHSAIDDWSLSLLEQEFGEFYRARVQRRPPQLAPLARRIGDFAVDQRAAGVDPVQLAWWRDRMRDAPEQDALPLDRPRPSEPRHTGGRIDVLIPDELARTVREFGREARATPFAVFAAALTVLLAGHSGRSDVVFGVPVSRRGAADLEPVIGCLTTLLPLRQSVRAGESFAALVTATKRLIAEIVAHRDTPYPALLRAVGRSADLSRTPLCQLALVVDDAPRTPLGLPGVEAVRIHPATGMSKFDLNLYLISEQSGYRGFLEYADEVLDRGTAERLAGAFVALVGSATAEPDRSVTELARDHGATPPPRPVTPGPGPSGGELEPVRAPLSGGPR
ncbi:non-ribosomal peptide synthetase [Symbioplanes lichenis]|uniref:non-ribosomal peptide synthetase n=1 Tax=Symbioplanes lichenis TaxID=1629072 RepID=UPI002738456E|nr:non-ribosomal peptide synthetase [Actinoplanes lichenis]